MCIEHLKTLRRGLIQREHLQSALAADWKARVPG